MSKLTRKRILITGGAGFIGSHLCDFFLAKGHFVICLDNLITGSMQNIKNNLTNKRFKFIKHDISKYISIDGFIDFVLHFASLASPVDYLNYPINTLKVGSLGTLNTLELAKRKKAKYLLASTSEVYGDPLRSPQKEDYWGNVNPVGPRSCYDESKRFSESMTMAFHNEYKLDVRIIRIFNTYGPRMQKDDGRVIPNFITQALSRKPLTVYGNGKQTRSFCYISDLIDGIFKLMLRDKFNRGQLGRIFNLGNPEEKTILELAKLINRIMLKKSFLSHRLQINRKPLPQDDPKIRKPDITKAKADLKWMPKVDLEEGIKKTINWFNYLSPRYGDDSD